MSKTFGKFQQIIMKLITIQRPIDYNYRVRIEKYNLTKKLSHKFLFFLQKLHKMWWFLLFPYLFLCSTLEEAEKSIRKLDPAWTFTQVSYAGALQRSVSFGIKRLKEAWVNFFVSTQFQKEAYIFKVDKPHLFHYHKLQLLQEWKYWLYLCPQI